MRGSEEVSGRFSSSPGFHVPARHHRGKVRVMLQKEEAVAQVAGSMLVMRLSLLDQFDLQLSLARSARSLARDERRK